MAAKVIILLCCILWLGACGSDERTFPTPVPTAATPTTPTTPTARLIPLPPTNTPIPSDIESEPNAINTIVATTDDAAEIDAVLQEIDMEACRQVFETQADLDALREQGKDVTELATAVAELAIELGYCESLLTPTPVD